jgi:manganese-transporting P-type ATPase
VPEAARAVDVQQDKLHVLFGGTKVLDASAGPLLETPDGGAAAVVLRTGFETAQGRLMRTILFSTERLTANTLESGLFICFLLVFAVSAAGVTRLSPSCSFC